jgi:hypothetical protein
MTWKSYLYYITATAIIASLIAKMAFLFGAYWGLIVGVVLGVIHIYINVRLSMELYNQSFPLKDRLIIGFLFPLTVLICFAAIYQQQGVICKPDNLPTNNFFTCLKVSIGNFIGHMVIECQATGDGVNVAVFEPLMGWGSLVITGSVIALFFNEQKRRS